VRLSWWPTCTRTGSRGSASSPPTSGRPSSPKLAANAFLAQRLSTVNALSAVCEATGAKIDEVTRVVGTDTRIGSTFLKTSVGWGGSCFKKDLNGLIYLCDTYHLKEVADYFRQVIAMNEYQKDRFSRRILKQMFGTVRRKRILLLGYAFKKVSHHFLSL
jgi:UDPglucose 6-dehydrogenase